MADDVPDFSGLGLTEAQLNEIRDWLLAAGERTGNAASYSIGGRALVRPPLSQVGAWLSGISRAKRRLANSVDGGIDLVSFN